MPDEPKPFGFYDVGQPVSREAMLAFFPWLEEFMPATPPEHPALYSVVTTIREAHTIDLGLPASPPPE